MRPELATRYRRRRPEVLYQVVAQHLESFLAEAPERTRSGAGYPAFIEDQLRDYLRCGILTHGFARVVCEACKAEDLVAFSCKGRLCPACAARRMNETALQLCDHTLPAAGCPRSRPADCASCRRAPSPTGCASPGGPARPSSSWPPTTCCAASRSCCPPRVSTPSASTVAWGCFAPRGACRESVLALVPPAASDADAACTICTTSVPPTANSEDPPARTGRPTRIRWTTLLKRTFGHDLLHCPCGGHRKVLACVTGPAAIRAILIHLGLPTEPPPIARARAPPQLDLFDHFPSALTSDWVD